MKCCAWRTELGWGIEEEVANRWRKLWKEKVQSGHISKNVAEEGFPRETREALLSRSNGGRRQSEPRHAFGGDAIDTQATTDVCGRLNSTAIGTRALLSFGVGSRQREPILMGLFPLSMSMLWAILISVEGRYKILSSKFLL